MRKKFGLDYLIVILIASALENGVLFDEIGAEIDD